MEMKIFCTVQFLHFCFLLQFIFIRPVIVNWQQVTWVCVCLTRTAVWNHWLTSQLHLMVCRYKAANDCDFSLTGVLTILTVWPPAELLFKLDICQKNAVIIVISTCSCQSKLKMLYYPPFYNLVQNKFQIKFQLLTWIKQGSISNQR